MQDELNNEYPNLDINLLGVNQDGFSSGNSTISTAGDIPLIQDNATDLIWSTWGVSFRDVVILNGENQIVASFNLTTYSLGDSTNYDTLKTMLINEASN